MDQPVDRCTIVKGNGRHILLIGDSHAVAWVPAFKEIARREDLTLSVSALGACPWQRDLFRPEIVFNGAAVRPEDCKKYRDDLYDRVIPELHPDVVVLAQFPYDDPDQNIQMLGPDLSPLKRDTPAVYRSALEALTAPSLAALRSGGRNVLVIESIPVAPRNGLDPLVCISQAKTLEQCRYLVSTQPSPLEDVYRALAAREPRVFSADFDRLVCPYLPICDPVVNGQIVKWDRQHMTVKFAESLADPVDAYLKLAGLLPRRPKSARAPARLDAPSER